MKVHSGHYVDGRIADAAPGACTTAEQTLKLWTDQVHCNRHDYSATGRKGTQFMHLQLFRSSIPTIR